MLDHGLKCTEHISPAAVADSVAFQWSLFQPGITAEFGVGFHVPPTLHFQCHF